MYNLRQNWKKWVMIYVVIGILVYAGIYYFLSQKGQKPYSTNYNYTQPTATTQPRSVQDETANWKTYTDSLKRFNLKYPPNWTFYQQDGRFENKTLEANEVNNKNWLPGRLIGDVKITYLSLMRSGTWTNLTINEFFDPNNRFWKSADSDTGALPEYSTAIEEVNIGGKRGMLQIYGPLTHQIDNPQQIIKIYLVPLEDKLIDILEISVTYNSGDNEADYSLKQFNQILSTFQFLN